MATPSVSSNVSVVSVTAPITVPVSQPPTQGISAPPPLCSLYVGDLEKEVTEVHLYEHFKVCGTSDPKGNGYIASIRVCRDWATKTSLRYAYVNFENNKEGAETAVVALNTLNHSLIMEKPCRVSWLNRNPAVRNPEANIFVKNLPKSVDSTSLQEYFAKFGEILSCKVNNTAAIVRGYVQFKEVESAKKAIETLNGTLLEGNQVSVEKFLNKKSRESTVQYTNVYTKNLPETFDEAKLKEFFSVCGKITSAIIGRDKKTNEPRTKVHEDGSKTLYGFVNFEKHENAVKAIEELNNKEINGKQITVVKQSNISDISKDKKKNYTTGTNLYVKYIPEDYTEEDFRKLFAPHGQIASLKIARNKDGASSGFGFVAFAVPEEAARALTINGQIIHGKPIYVAYHQTKDQRQNYIMTQQKQVRNFAPNNFMSYPYGQRSYNPMQPYSRQQQRFTNNPNPGRKFSNNNAYPQRKPQQQQQPQQQQAQVKQQMASVVAAPAVNIQAIDKESFNKMSTSDQREALGEAIYGYIDEAFGDKVNSGKITGMVLESTNGNFETLNELIKNGQIQQKIQEAIIVYNSHIKTVEKPQ